MAGEKLLTETSCKAAKPKPKTYYLDDGGGLRLRCRPNGGRTWVFRYRLNSKENKDDYYSFTEWQTHLLIL